jgi:hypothetical protein
MKPIDLTETVNGKLYFSVKNFAWVTKRSEQNVRFLMAKGNKQRKLVVERVMGKPMIPFSELTEYPFGTPGRNASVYHYDINGLIVQGDEHAVQDGSIFATTESV